MIQQIERKKQREEPQQTILKTKPKMCIYQTHTLKDP